jgi:hypothetical protein
VAVGGQAPQAGTIAPLTGVAGGGGQVGDGLGRDRVGQLIRAEKRTGLGRVEQLRDDAVDPDPGRA